MNADPYVILDARGLALHAYHSGTDKEGGRASDGTPLATPGHTLANFLERHLLPITEHTRLNHIIAVWDGGNQYRERLTGGTYKDHRGELNEELKESRKKSEAAVKTLLANLGIVQCAVKGVEADDVIAYLSWNLRGVKMIHTRDGDLIQLADDETIVFYNCAPATEGKFKGEIVPAHLITLFKSLCGDDSDGYGGVPGFGPAGWRKLLENCDVSPIVKALEAGDMARVRELARQIPELKRATDNFEAWMLGWKLASLHPELVNQRDGKGVFQKIQWHKRLPNAIKVRQQMEVTGNAFMLEKIDHLLPKRWIYDATAYDPADIDEAHMLFSQSPFVAVDWETKDILKHQPFKQAADKNYVDLLSQRMVGAGFTYGRNLEYTMYLPFDHRDSANLSKDVLLDLLEAVPDNVPVVAHNANFENAVLRTEFGVQIPEILDTIPLGVHVDEHAEQGLKEQSLVWLGHKQTHYDEVVPEGKDMSDLSADEVFEYGTDDTICTAHLFDLFSLILEIEGTLDFALEYETRTQDVALEGLLAGITIDWEELDRQGTEDRKTVEDNMLALRELLRQNTDANTAREGAQILYEDDLPVLEARFQDGDYKGMVPDGIKAEGEVTFEQVLDWHYNKCLSAATYEDLTVTKALPKTFATTTASLNKVIAALGLPELVTEGECPNNIDIGKYFDEVDRADDLGALAITVQMRKFLELLGDAAIYLNSKDNKKAAKKARDESPERAALIEFCKEVMWEAKDSKGQYDKQGCEFNLNSPPQMKALIYGIIGVPIRIRQPLNKRTGYRERYELEPSAQTNEEAIQAALAFDAQDGWKKDALKLLLAAKKANTRIQNFYNPYPLWKHPSDGNIHPKLMTAGTKTRRPTSGNPNMLNWPKKGEGLKFRNCILPNAKLGHDLIVSCDWDQLELRLAAGLSGDKAMLACYMEGSEKDIHALTAHKVAGVSYELFKAILDDEDHELHKQYKDIRGKAKNTTFGSQYGIGPSKLARQIMQPLEVAQEYLAEFEATYWRLAQWKQEMTDQLHRDGYLRTALGSYRHVFNDLNHPEAGMVGHIERSSVNALIQGVAADYLKVVLTRMHRRGSFSRHGAVLICPLYDEIIVSLHHSQAVGFLMEMYEEMTRGIPGLPVALPAAPALGINFGAQIEIGRNPTPERILAAIDKAFGRVNQKAA